MVYPLRSSESGEGGCGIRALARSAVLRRDEGVLSGEIERRFCQGFMRRRRRIVKTLKTAVVGLGRIGWQFHIPSIIGHEQQFSLAAVVDVSQERLAEAQETYCVSGYTDIAEMIRAEKPDLVVIASPTHLHREHACAAMKMGVDVFLDKPMAQDYESAMEIARCARETGRKLMVYQPHRATPVVNQLRRIIESGKLGRLVALQLAAHQYTRRADWQAFRKYGGGMLNNYGAHYIDVLLHLSRDRVKRLFCVKDAVATLGDADDVARVMFQTERGITLDLDINQAAAVAKPTWAVYGQYGAVMSQTDEQGKTRLCLRWYDPEKLPKLEASEALAAKNRQYSSDVPIPWVTEEIAVDAADAVDFYGKVYEYYAEGKAPYVPIEETLYVMDLIRQCHENAEEDRQ